MCEEDFDEQDDEWALLPDHHQRTVLHIDVDCFYAQVEMVRNPSLRDKPLGIKQKNLMVTCNYMARSLGVKKSMWLKEALEILPNLVLVDGSDLSHYRQFSSKISAIAQTFTPHVERLGLDENFIDVTDIVGNYLCAQNDKIEGHVYGDKAPNLACLGDQCGCGCRERLIAGTYIAKELRQQIHATLGLTCCAGIAHNKLLAKLVSGYHKPNQQTVLFPWQVHDIMNSLHSANSIPGIGYATSKVLEELGILTVQQLQNSAFKILTSKFDNETSQRLKDLSLGIDETPVKKSGRPQSIGLEDAFQKIISVAEVREKYYTLLERLLKLLADDGRIPSSVKVSVRKFNTGKMFRQRETKQAPLSSSLFTQGGKNVNEDTKCTLLNVIMGLFHKMVDTSKDFHLTLVGVGFNKFIERAHDSQAISNFFSKRPREQITRQTLDYEETDVMKRSKLCQASNNKQTVNLEITQMKSCVSSSEITQSTYSINDSSENFKDSFNNRLLFETSKSSTDVKYIGDKVMVDKTNENVSVSDTRKDLVLSENCNIPDKLVNNEKTSTQNPEKHVPFLLPSGIDREVFIALPVELQREILDNSKQNTNVRTEKVLQFKQVSPMKNNLIKNKKIDNYFKPQVSVSTIRPNVHNKKKGSSVSVEELCGTGIPCTVNVQEKDCQPSCSYTMKDSSQIQCSGTSNGETILNSNRDSFRVESSPHKSCITVDEIDPSVFNALPECIQNEIFQEQELAKQICSFQPKKTLICSNRKRRNSVSILKYLKKL